MPGSSLGRHLESGVDPGNEVDNHSTLLGLGLENDGKQMISNCLQGKLDRLWMIRGGSTLVGADRFW